MFSVQNPDLMGRLDFRPKKKILKMTLPAKSARLYGEVAENRFHSLAATLGAEPKIDIEMDL